MRAICFILLSLTVSFQSFASVDPSEGALRTELSSSQGGTADNARGMHFSGADFNSIFVDLVVIAGIIAIGQQLPRDKRLHLYGGALTGRVASILCGMPRFNENRTEKEIKHRKFLCSCGAASAVGILKEVRDKVTKKGTPEFADAFVTGAGGCAIGARYIL